MKRETEETMLQPAGATGLMVNNRKARRAAKAEARKAKRREDEHSTGKGGQHE